MRIPFLSRRSPSNKPRTPTALARSGPHAETASSSPTGYDELTSLACRHAAAAYSDPGPGEGVLLSDPATDAQAVVRVDADGTTAIVAFRGSESAGDWVHNAMTPLSPLPSPHRASVRAHSGFLRQYTSLHARMMRELQKGGVKHVVLCGHSLGGALAVISAAMLPEPMTCDVVTFGAPRPGNSDLADAAYNRCLECVRVIHDRDVVPTVPLKAMGYAHVCEPWLVLDGDGGVKREQKERGVWSQAALRARGILSLDFGVRDHLMDAYLRGVPDRPTDDADDQTATP